jgi:MtN3 and saliva related transmembrane protein
MTEIVGWTSSLLLLTTIVVQIGKQWSERSGEGVSVWLFIGQAGASLGFTIYSALLKNWVFTVTNALMLLSAIIGWSITSHFKSRAQPSKRMARGCAAAVSHRTAPS